MTIIIYKNETKSKCIKLFLLYLAVPIPRLEGLNIDKELLLRSVLNYNNSKHTLLRAVLFRKYYLAIIIILIYLNNNLLNYHITLNNTLNIILLQYYR